MRNYELTLILSPELAEEEAKNIGGNITALFQNEGALLGKQEMQGKKLLLSPVKKYREGYLCVLSFTVNQEKIPNLEKALRAQPHVLRHMLLSLAPRKTVIPTFAKATASTSRKESTLHLPKEEKIDLEDIDKKLEEIFQKNGSQ